MPTIENKRTWCKCCSEFTVHNWLGKFGEENLICEDCKTEFSSYNYSEVPEEKLLEQRKRYSNKKLYSTLNILNSFSKLENNGFLPRNQNFNLIEDNVGQKEIDDLERENKKKINQEKLEQNILKGQEYQLYKHLGRNDKCSCGSNKKYKSCHMSSFDDIKKRYLI